MLKREEKVFVKYRLQVLQSVYVPEEFAFLFHGRNNLTKGVYYFMLHCTNYRFERTVQKLRRKFRKTIKVKIAGTYVKETA
jgi:hypothetical protein